MKRKVNRKDMNLEETLFKQFPTLPTLSEFVDWTDIFHKDDAEWLVTQTNKTFYELVLKYNTILKQPLELRRLIPCKDNEPLPFTVGKNGTKIYNDVWFSGFKISEHSDISKGHFEFTNGFYYQGNALHKDEYVSDKSYTSHVWNLDGRSTISSFTGQPVTLNFWKQFN